MTFLHVVAIICAGVTVLYTDKLALSWLRGKKQVLDTAVIDRAHIAVSIGLAVIIATGGLLFLPRAEFLLTSPLFAIKMCFVLALIINGFFIDKLATTATERPFSSLSRREKLPLFISGAVSITGWVGAIICGLLLAG